MPERRSVRLFSIASSLAPARRAGTIMLAVLMLAGWARSAQAASYVIDSDNTEVRATWDHLGMSRQSVRFTQVSGVVEFDETAPEQSRVEVTIKSASLLSGIDTLDKALRSPDYFNVAKFPQITFVSKSVRAVTDRTGEVTGDLTIMGIARPVTLHVTWNYTGEYPLAAISPNYKGMTASGFSATARVKRSEWGLDRSVPLIGDEIAISIEVEMFMK
jgi:polyisoprenoid-binding protein YceI